MSDFKGKVINHCFYVVQHFMWFRILFVLIKTLSKIHLTYHNNFCLHSIESNVQCFKCSLFNRSRVLCKSGSHILPNMCPKAIFISVFNCAWVFQDTQLEITFLLSEEILIIWPLQGYITWRSPQPVNFIQNCNFLLRKKKSPFLDFAYHYLYNYGKNLQLIGTYPREEPIEKGFGSEWNFTLDSVAIETIIVILSLVIPKLFQRHFLFIRNLFHPLAHSLPQDVIWNTLWSSRSVSTD